MPRSSRTRAPYRLHVRLDQADFPRVIAAAAAGFSEVLDQKLSAAAQPSIPPLQAGFRTAPFIPADALHYRPRPAYVPDAPEPPCQPQGSVVSAFSRNKPGCSRLSSPVVSHFSRTVRSRGRRIELRTSDQRYAFETLRRLGADLSACELYDLDLRRAFRALARRYHPDVHSGASAEHRVALASRFAEASSAYAVLVRER